MKCILLLVASVLSALPMKAVAGDAIEAKPARVIALIGDSPVCDYPPAVRLRGWGQLLPELLAPGVSARNEAAGGLSTKTYPRGRWLGLLKARPDFVLIQFGHNDSHAKGQPESTDAVIDYAENLRRFVDEARAAGVTPVLVTPVRRRTFSQGKPTEELARYAEAMRRVAVELQAPPIDFYRSSGELFAELGEEGTTSFTINETDQADRPGRGDRTHFTETGARVIAGLVAQAMARADPRLRMMVHASSANSGDDSI